MSPAQRHCSLDITPWLSLASSTASAVVSICSRLNTALSLVRCCSHLSGCGAAATPPSHTAGSLDSYARAAVECHLSTGQRLQALCTYVTCTAPLIQCTNAGGYHPVRVGEKYCNGRYTVLQKLGWGHFSTVWLVRDATTGMEGAMKVCSSGQSLVHCQAGAMWEQQGCLQSQA